MTSFVIGDFLSHDWNWFWALVVAFIYGARASAIKDIAQAIKEKAEHEKH